MVMLPMDPVAEPSKEVGVLASSAFIAKVK